jgi:transcriptional regulator with XRE-family HTH domain
LSQQQIIELTTFQDRLRFLRGNRSQAEFAELLGISSQQTYANYERGRIPKYNVLENIAQRLGVTTNFLLKGDERHAVDKKPLSFDDQQVSLNEEAASYGDDSSTDAADKPLSLYMQTQETAALLEDWRLLIASICRDLKVSATVRAVRFEQLAEIQAELSARLGPEFAKRYRNLKDQSNPL